MQALGVVSTGAGHGVASTANSFLSMYNDQPTEELTLQDFEVLALDRLKGAWSEVCVECTRHTASSRSFEGH